MKLEQCIWAVKGGRVLLEQQEQGGRREGMWALPVAKVDKRRKPIYRANYAITHYKVDLCVYATSEPEEKNNNRWVAFEELDQIPMPSPFRKAVEALLLREDKDKKNG